MPWWSFPTFPRSHWAASSPLIAPRILNDSWETSHSHAPFIAPFTQQVAANGRLSKVALQHRGSLWINSASTSEMYHTLRTDKRGDGVEAATKSRRRTYLIDRAQAPRALVHFNKVRGRGQSSSCARIGVLRLNCAPNAIPNSLRQTCRVAILMDFPLSLADIFLRISIFFFLTNCFGGITNHSVNCSCSSREIFSEK